MLGLKTVLNYKLLFLKYQPADITKCVCDQTLLFEIKKCQKRERETERVERVIM